MHAAPGLYSILVSANSTCSPLARGFTTTPNTHSSTNNKLTTPTAHNNDSHTSLLACLEPTTAVVAQLRQPHLMHTQVYMQQPHGASQSRCILTGTRSNCWQTAATAAGSTHLITRQPSLWLLLLLPACSPI